MPVFGNTTAYSQSNNQVNTQGTQLVMGITASTTFKAKYITHLMATDLANESGYYFRFVIFSDNGANEPDKLLSCTVEAGPFNDEDIENTWQTLKLLRSVRINSGTKYWIGVWNHDPQSVGRRDDLANPQNVQYSTWPDSVYLSEKCVNQGAAHGWSTTGYYDFSNYAHDFFASGILTYGGAIIEWRNRICSVFRNTSGDLEIYELNEDAPRSMTTQTPTTIHGSASDIAFLAADVDSNGNIHVLSCPQEIETRDFAYNTFNLGTESWGTWEQAHDFTDGVPGDGSRSCALTVDSSNIAHILVLDGERDKGTTYGQVYYNVRTGGTWGTAELVNTNTADYHDMLRISLAPAGDVEALYYNNDLSDVMYRRRNGSWGTEGSYATPGVVYSVAVTAADTVHRFHGDGSNNILEDNSDSGENSYSGAVMEAWASIGRSGPIIFYVDANQDIAVYDTSTGETIVLEIGTYVRVVAEYSYENSRGYINYLAENSANELIQGRYSKREAITSQ